MNLPNPFRTSARRIGSGRVHRTIRKPVPPRLGVTLLEDRVTPSGSAPVQVSAAGGWQFYRAAGADR